MPTPRIIKGDDAISWCTKHGPIPRTGNGESFFVVYKNYVNNDNLEEIEIELVPDSGQGITHPEYSNAGGFSPIIMEEDYWCFKYRTIHGFVGLAISRDQGQTWKMDILRYNPGGRPVKSPQGPYSFIEDPKGRKFFTYYNISDSGFDKFVGRDLVYLSRVRIKDNRFYFSQPELFHYRQDQLGYLNDSHKRLNPPHFIKKDDGVLCRVSDKEFLKEFRMPMTFLDLMDRQSTIREIPQNGLVFKEKNPKSRLNLPLLPNPLNNGGFTISFTIELKNSQPYKSTILQNGHAGKGVKILTGKNQDLLFVMNDGKQEVSLTSDAGVLRPGQKHAVSIIVDGYPDLVSMVVDERFQDGGTEKCRGTKWFGHDFSDINTESQWILSDDENILVSSLYVHDRFLLTTEAIGMQRMME
jgi:hypothetical protein